jgi:hypothetical protein
VHDPEKHDLCPKGQLIKQLCFAIFRIFFFFVKSNKSLPYACESSNIDPFYCTVCVIQNWTEATGSAMDGACVHIPVVHVMVYPGIFCYMWYMWWCIRINSATCDTCDGVSGYILLPVIHVMVYQDIFCYLWYMWWCIRIYSATCDTCDGVSGYILLLNGSTASRHQVPALDSPVLTGRVDERGTRQGPTAPSKARLKKWESSWDRVDQQGMRQGPTAPS